MAVNKSEYALHLNDGKGKTVVALPGDELPGWAKITNPYVLGDQAVVEDGEGDAAGDGPPPRKGKGSGESEWRAYAERKGVDVTDVEGRDGIIDALDAEGVPVG